MKTLGELVFETVKDLADDVLHFSGVNTDHEDEEDNDDESDDVSSCFDTHKCSSCDYYLECPCISECPVEAISGFPDFTIDLEACISCGACEAVCPKDAITIPSQDQRDNTQDTESEQEYLDHLKELLEDDTDITPRERKMLDKIRQNLGISEERAKELEDALRNPQLTKSEQEYLDQLKEILEDDTDITPRERKMLDKIRQSLGIGEERAKQLEALVSNPQMIKDENEEPSTLYQTKDVSSSIRSKWEGTKLRNLVNKRRTSGLE